MVEHIPHTRDLVPYSQTPAKELLPLPDCSRGLGLGVVVQCPQVQHYISGTAGTGPCVRLKPWACLLCKPRKHSLLGFSSCLSLTGRAYRHHSLSMQKKMEGQRNSVAKITLGPRSSSPEALLLQCLPGSLVLLETRTTSDSAFFLSFQVT